MIRQYIQYVIQHFTQALDLIPHCNKNIGTILQWQSVTYNTWTKAVLDDSPLE